MSQHWTERDFLNALYGIGPQDGHLEQCAECRAEFDRLREARRDLLDVDVEIPGHLLDAQRSRIARSVATRRRPVWVWAPVAAAAGVMLVAIVLNRPPVSAPETADSQLLADIYTAAFDAEPDALEPLHGLFQAADTNPSKEGTP